MGCHMSDEVKNKKRGKRQRAAVVVLGDIGRCPRMQYHALSLSKQAGLDVDVVAFSGTDPHSLVLEDPQIHLHLMKSPFPVGLPRVLYLLLLPFKVLLQVVTLLWVLCVQIPAPDLFLVQNPPSIPTLTVVRLACWLRKASFVIDWHNFGYTLLGLNLGLNHPLVKIHFWYERRYGKMADGYLCVTKAMQHELAQNWSIKESLGMNILMAPSARLIITEHHELAIAIVVYDRSPDFFRPVSIQEKHEVMSRLHKAMLSPLGNQDCCSEYVEGSEGGEHAYESTSRNDTDSPADAGPSTWTAGYEKWDEGRGGLSSCPDDNAAENRGLLQGDYVLPNVHHTLFTSHTMVEGIEGDTAEILEGDLYSNREGRPALVISSTSWTADEDFNILLEAALMYDRRVAALLGESDSVLALADNALRGRGQSTPFPRLLIVVTGKGPMRAMYEEQIRKLRLRRVAFRTMWVSAADYPLLLGSADLGVCLHTSSSGLDLPMKVVDMFGCGLPVCAASYSCIGELVIDRQNGLLFSSSSELADQLLDLFKGFPNACDLLSALQEGAKASGSGARWNNEWSEHVLPLVRKAFNNKDTDRGLIISELRSHII